MRPEDSEQPSTWKNRREWLASIIGVLGICVSVGAYLLSRNSTNSGKSLILVAEKADNIAGNLGLSFLFRPLNTSQKISRISIFFPPAISTGLESAQPLTQEMDLSVVSHLVEHYETAHRSPSAGVVSLWDGNIPVVLEAQYVFGDESLVHRGIYKLRARIMWRPSGPTQIKFLDVTFDRALSADANYREALTNALGNEEDAQRRLFNPTR